MGIMDKAMIETWILPHLTIGTRRFDTTVPLTEIVRCIFHRLKTGCQWRELPTKEFFTDKVLHWNSVFYYYNKWSKANCWRTIWVNLLTKNRTYLDMSSVEFDGSHTPAKNGGDGVGYQGRKACNTTNALFIADNQGVMLAMSTPQEGQHHDLFQIQILFDEICQLLKEAGLDLKGLFLNADAGFDSAEFVAACEKEQIIANVKDNPRNSATSQQPVYEQGTHIFDAQLYQDRSVIELANAWIDGFKALLVRFEFSVRNWMSLHFIAFSVIFLRKVNRKRKV
ncbi:transposase [Spirosoma sp. HMF4905]|uniref:Transposase n=1 Tax=Spirosoma arboris TaxID=2682092 RepID=A0A7K1SK92_9BACT|nr:transposase [Spirosoma arboris]MVM34016.1 transposase [Spirosoma arboris]